MSEQFIDNTMNNNILTLISDPFLNGAESDVKLFIALAFVIVSITVATAFSVGSMETIIDHKSIA